MHAPFALLDDLGAAGQPRRSRLYTGLAGEHRAATPQALDATWAAVQADQRAGLHAVLLADYEWGVALGQAGPAEGWRAARAAAVGGLRVLMFRQLQHLDTRATARWLAAAEHPGTPGDAPDEAPDEAPDQAPGPAGVLDIGEAIDDDRFGQAIEAIHAAIRRGETYQVNFTDRLHGRAFGEPVALYRRLRARQPVAYGALVALPPVPGEPTARWVLSLSPELFLRHAGGWLEARPMKGTAPRHPGDEGADAAAAAWLRADAKNRAENLMIVDLLRNDLGRVAVPGSVQVPALFETEGYATVWQMTSTVRARPRPGLDLPALLRATFPCGSITGAPKHRTMQLIRALEGSPRGLYCGAIGWVDAPEPGQSLGACCLSVAIRTLTLGEASDDGTRPLACGVGAGIVLDSVAADERRECRLKARFLTGMDPGVRLIETLRWTPHGGVALWPRHVARLAASAAALGFPFDDAAFAAGLAAVTAGRQADGPWRLRVTLGRDGRFGWHMAPLDALPTGPDGAVRLRWANEALPRARPLAGHKTTDRAAYDRAVQAAVAAGAFDSLLLRDDGVLLEGGRSNVFVRLDGRWWTPPLADGVLPGVMRGALLDDPAWGAAERRLTRADVERAQAVVVCNALRGVLPARLG
ncbi:chorismate-binding protein [Ideonella sp.]|uniref:chorismate-binding protein n=1 Tax=Ideonella sp. TaxID=1929293 RepID=UPI0035B33AAB